MTFAKRGYKETFNYLKNFGFEDEVEMVMPGTNAKMNKLQVFMGLGVLGRLDEIIVGRVRDRSSLRGVQVSR